MAFFSKKSIIEAELLDREIGKELDTETAVEQYAAKLKRIKAADPTLTVALRRTADGKLFNMKWGEIEKLSPETLQKYEFIGSKHDIKGKPYIPIIWLPLYRKFELLKQGGN